METLKLGTENFATNMLNTNTQLNKTHKLYKGEVQLVFNDAGHRYQVDGKEKVGVTTALSVINKPALLQWAVNEAINYLKNEFKAGQGYDELELNNLLENAKKAHRVRKQTAADFGTLAHKWIEQYIKGENPEPPVNKNLRKATEVFIKWVKDNNVVFTHCEQPVYSRKYDYCGTVDFICEIDGKSFIGDLKTSKGIYSEYHMQLAAYRIALEEEHEKSYAGTLIVRIPKEEDDNVEIAYINNYRENARAFLYALGLYKTTTLLKNFAKGGAK